MRPRQNPLTRIPDIARGENLYGYMRRLAVENGYDRLDTFRYETGLTSFGTTSDDERWQRFGDLTITPQADLEPLRWRSGFGLSGDSVVSFLGGTVRRTFISMKRMRYCPICLAHDGILRDFWALHYALACPRHAVLLVDACDECGEAFDYRSKTAPWSCRCGRSMTSVATRPASPIAMHATMMLLPSLGTRSVFRGIAVTSQLKPPSSFRNCTANDLMTVIDHVGTIAVAPAQDDPIRPARAPKQFSVVLGADPPAMELVARAEAAMPIMNGWPEEYHVLLNELNGRREPEMKTTNRRAMMFATELGNRAIMPPRGIDGTPIAPLTEAVTSYFRLPHILYRAGERRTVYLGTGGNGHVLWTKGGLVSFLTRRTGWSRGEAWIHPELLQPVSENDGAPLFDARDAGMLVNEFARRLSPWPPAGQTIPLHKVRFKNPSGFGYNQQNALLDIQAGRLGAFSATGELVDAVVPVEDIARNATRRRAIDVISGGTVLYPKEMLDLIQAVWPERDRLKRGELEQGFYDDRVRVATSGRTGIRGEHVLYGYIAKEFITRCRRRFGSSPIVSDHDLSAASDRTVDLPSC